MADDQHYERVKGEKKYYNSIRNYVLSTYSHTHTNQSTIAYYTLKQGVHINKINEYVYSVLLGIPKLPKQKRAVAHHGFIIFHKNKNKILLIDVIANPALNSVIHLFCDTLNCEISGILLTHRHPIYLSDQSSWNTAVDTLNKYQSPIYLHKSSQNHMDSLLFMNDKPFPFTHPINGNDLFNDFDIKISKDIGFKTGHTEGDIIIYHTTTKSLFVGDLAMGSSKDALIEPIPFYLNPKHKENVIFWKTFSMKYVFGVDYDIQYFIPAHYNFIDLKQRKLTIGELLCNLK
eukprot:74119_1